MFMKLSRAEITLLSALSQRGDISVPEISQHAHLKSHVARYALSRLKQRDVIWPYTFINLRPLGYHARTLTLALACDNENRRKAFTRMLISRPDVSWVAEFSGDYQVACTVHTQSDHELKSIFHAIHNVQGVAIIDKQVRTELSLTYFPLKYFLEQNKRTAILEATYRENSVKVDDVDRKILSGLARRVGESHASIARALKLPATTFHERYKSLVQRGVICASTYFLNMHKAGLYTFKALVSLRTAPATFESELKEFCHLHPNVSLLVSCAGAWDYEINFDINNLRAANECIQTLQNSFRQYIQKVQVLQLLQHIKVVNYPF
jgi:DNA-binding Lrp family transcriptional regulator